MSQSSVSPSAVGPRRRGRPLSPTSPEHRRKCLAVARARLVDGMTVRKVAELAEIDRATVYRWTNLALIYPEGQYLRRHQSA